MIATLRAVSLDCEDPPALMEFYRGVAGGEVVFASEDFAALKGDGQVWLTAQRVADHRPSTWPDDGVPKQVHLEFAVDELVDSVAQAVALGARVADSQPSPERWQVLLDPAGHPFCFTTMIAPD